MLGVISQSKIIPALFSVPSFLLSFWVVILLSLLLLEGVKYSMVLFHLSGPISGDQE